MASVSARVGSVTLTIELSGEEASALRKVNFSTSVDALKVFDKAIFPNWVNDTKRDALLIRDFLFEIKQALTE